MNKEIAGSMYLDRRKKAVEYLQHYFRIAFRGANSRWNEDNDAEMESLADSLIQAADYLRIADEAET